MYTGNYVYANPAQVRILPAMAPARTPATEGMTISIRTCLEGEGPSMDRSRLALESMTTPLTDDTICAKGF